MAFSDLFGIGEAATAAASIAAAATHGSVVGTQTNAWQAVLGALIGTYGVVRQHQLLTRQVDLAERGVDQAEQYLAIATDAYVNIAVPTVVRQNYNFDRYTSAFAGFEELYMADAFRLEEYTPQYSVQQGRALGSVQAQFDKAALQRARQIGRYNTGRRCNESLQFITMAALARVDAANHGYRYEDSKKITLDGWYWERRSAGARVNEAHAARVTSGLNGGATVGQGGVELIGNAVGRVQQGIGQVANAMGERANFFGSIANGAFRYAGANVSMGNMSGSGPNSPAGNFTTAAAGGLASGMMGGLMGNVPFQNWMPGPTSSASAGIPGSNSWAWGGDD